MAEINQCKSNEMGPQPVGILALKTDKQLFEFIDPGKGAFSDEPTFVNLGIEQAFTSSLGMLAITFVLRDIGNKAVIEAGFAGGLGIKGTISVEKSPSKVQSDFFHRFEAALQMSFQVKGIIMMK